jgi:hypothetical protein
MFANDHRTVSIALEPVGSDRRIPTIESMSVIANVFTCVFRGHRWDVAPGFRRGAQIECVRCGMRSDAVAGLRS